MKSVYIVGGYRTAVGKSEKECLGSLDLMKWENKLFNTY